MKSADYFFSNPAHRQNDTLTNCTDCMTSALAEVISDILEYCVLGTWLVHTTCRKSYTFCWWPQM